MRNDGTSLESLARSMNDVRRFVVASCVVVSVAALGAKYRSWHLRWGSTDEEVHGRMPGDDLLDGAAFTVTRAVCIAAPPTQVWPWLAQVGFGRGGFYSYDLLDNLGRPSAEEILPSFQTIAVGDLAAPMASPANEQNSFVVAEAHEPSVLVWSKPDSTWAWRLTADDAGGTRLVTRLKARYSFGPFLPLTMVLMEVGDFPMMRRMLIGLRSRAENRRGGRRVGVDRCPCPSRPMARSRLAESDYRRRSRPTVTPEQEVKL